MTVCEGLAACVLFLLLQPQGLVAAAAAARAEQALRDAQQRANQQRERQEELERQQREEERKRQEELNRRCHNGVYIAGRHQVRSNPWGGWDWHYDCQAGRYLDANPNFIPSGDPNPQFNRPNAREVDSIYESCGNVWTCCRGNLYSRGCTRP